MENFENEMEVGTPKTPSEGFNAERFVLTPGDEIDADPSEPNENHERVNPFDKMCLKNLSSNFWSPSVFENVDMGETPPQVGWDVDQMAKLFPKPIEDSPSSHMNPYPVDPATEAKAQATINDFFKNGLIAPSPEEDPRVPKRKGPLFEKLKDAEEHHNDRWTNTALSLPTSDLPLELEAALAPYFQTEVCSGSSKSETHPKKHGMVRRSRSFKEKNVRRKLDLSFGEYTPTSSTAEFAPCGDPFESNHMISSPMSNGNGCYSEAGPSREFKSPNSSFIRSDMTPNRNCQEPKSPDITPIRGSPTSSQ